MTIFSKNILKKKISLPILNCFFNFRKNKISLKNQALSSFSPISRKTNESILRKVCYKPTNGWTKGQTSEWMDN